MKLNTNIKQDFKGRSLFMGNNFTGKMFTQGTITTFPKTKPKTKLKTFERNFAYLCRTSLCPLSIKNLIGTCDSLDRLIYPLYFLKN